MRNEGSVEPRTTAMLNALLALVAFLIAAAALADGTPPRH
jgi:hypothetical protein